MKRLRAAGIAGAVLVCGVVAYAVFAPKPRAHLAHRPSLTQRLDRRCRFP